MSSIAATKANYFKRNRPVLRDVDALLAKELDHFFARLKSNRAHPLSCHPLPPSTPVSKLRVQQVRCLFKAVNPREAAGQDGELGKVLRACKDQLSEVWTRIFVFSLKQATIPSCLIPIPRKTTISCLDDFRPIALTSVLCNSSHIRLQEAQVRPSPSLHKWGLCGKDLLQVSANPHCGGFFLDHQLLKSSEKPSSGCTSSECFEGAE